MSTKAMQRRLARLVFSSRRWTSRRIQRFAEGVLDLRILELGSGRQDLGADAYSMRRYFDPSNEFIQSDVMPEYGHTIVDVTTMSFNEEFDIVLCINVLEHVFDFQTAIDRVHAALRPGGHAVFVVPVLFPWHDEPNDFWRFTEHSLRQLLANFDHVDLRHRGLRQLPFSYFAIARK